MGIIEWVAVGVLLAAGALFIGFPFGVAVGISALALPDVRPAGRIDVLHVGKPAEEVKAASPGLSAPVIAKEPGIPHAPPRPRGREGGAWGCSWPLQITRVGRHN